MEKMGLNEIRRQYLEFFNEKGHLVVPSYPLVPLNDKSLLLINAGMAPLKPYFSGTEEPPNKRMATCQKCIRTGDIENVGRTSRHATFFEMLGNFSFGDYFKLEAIQWSWEFVTQHLKLPVDKLWPSVYLEDDEAYDIWHKIVGVPQEKIVRLGKADNFWEIGTGPCGPCSEIYYDRGERYGCGSENCKPGCDCDRYIEFWNLVFTQFDKDEEGNYNLLPKPNIDTGMGLERVACIMQDVHSIFDVDTMVHILNKVCSLTGAEYLKDPRNDVSIRIITDHIRSITFMISDGIIPSNEGRGYVLRRLLRRAARHGKLLGQNNPFLYQLMEAVADTYGDTYAELRDKKEYIIKAIKIEEERFQETINQGLEILNQHIIDLEGLNENILKGEYAFKLYDTFGFPLELTKEILEEKAMDVDEASFEEEMNKQRERARSARAEGDIEGWKEDIFASLDKGLKTSFEGYGKLQQEAQVLAIAVGNTNVGEAAAGDEAIVITNVTPCYPEGGGQVGDKGQIYSSSFNGSIIDTKKGANNRILHVIKLQEGKLSNGDMVTIKVTDTLRNATAKNHTATHLLHKALKEVVGDHVQQAGSLVNPERLRFDFTHFEGLKQEELKRIENIINDKIVEAMKVDIFETSLQEAKALGAEALFGEKYGETVRVVKSGDYSTELCGGTHVSNTSEIGMLLIISEGGIAAGVRRIEAITGKEAYNHVKQQQETMVRLSEVIKAQPSMLVNRAEAIMQELKDKEREISKLKSQLAKGATENLIDSAIMIKDVTAILHNLGEGEMDDLRNAADTIKEKLESGIIVLASEKDGKANFVATVTKDMIARGLHAGNIVKEAAKIAGGGGGGRPDMAQAGGKNPEKIGEALTFVKGFIEDQIK